MDKILVKNWSELETIFRGLQFAYGPQKQLGGLWFRGQSKASYELLPSIDREQLFTDDASRNKRINQLLDRFRHEAILLGLGTQLPEGIGLELLARHHGLPSPLIDWSLSPYVASFFAFFDATAASGEDVAIYVLRRPNIAPDVIDPEGPVELIDDPTHIRFNRRACQQRGVFLRRASAMVPLEKLLGHALIKLQIPASEREPALSHLDSMLLNPTSLMYDLDGAAKTAVWRTA
jgi:FRG domain